MIVDLFRVDFMVGRGAPPSKNFNTFFGIIRVMSMTAIIPAAGLGTRFLPATRVAPRSPVRRMRTSRRDSSRRMPMLSLR